MDGWDRVAAAVEDRRSALDWTQRRLAEEAGVAERTVQNLEAGKRPQARIRGRIERALGWEPGELRRIAEGQPEPEPVIPKSLLREIMRTEDLTPGEREAVIAAIERTLRGEPPAPQSGAARGGPGADPAPERRAAS